MKSLKWLGYSIVALLVVGLALSTSWKNAALSDRTPATPMVMWIEEESHATARGQTAVPEILIDTYERLFPDQPVRWQFHALNPANIDEVRRRIETLEPQLVVFSNQTFLPALEGWSNATPVLSPSERAPEVLERKYASLRSQRPIAFLSWFPAAQGKLIEHLRTISNGNVKRVTSFIGPSLASAGVDEAFRVAAASYGIAVATIQYQDFDELASLLPRVVAADRPDALFIPISNEIAVYGAKVAQLANQTGLPTAYSRRDQVAAGGLIATHAPIREIWEQVARYTAMITGGANASRLEIVGPSRFESSINIATAKELGFQLPFDLLMEAALIYPR